MLLLLDEDRDDFDCKLIVLSPADDKRNVESRKREMRGKIRKRKVGGMRYAVQETSIEWIVFFIFTIRLREVSLRRATSVCAMYAVFSREEILFLF